MSAQLIFYCVLGYSALLFFVVWLTSRKADNESFFIGNRSSRWYVVAYGMIGASLSGVTFMSVPGLVGVTQFSYLMVVFGYLAGYAVIAGILIPLYYRMNLTSIYAYLETRFGFWSHKTGAMFFILSRTVGASFRLFIVINVLQSFVFDQWNVPFGVTVAVFIILILIYTFKGGVKTIVWTDTLQTTFMLLSVVLAVIFISQELNFSFSDLFNKISNSDYSNVVVTDWHQKNYFVKHFFGGMFIAIAMTGLDQEMMQKNISVRTVGGSQKNMISFSIVLVFINILFLALGALLYMYASAKGIELPKKTDDLFPTIALNYLGIFSAALFVIGLISAAYPSADGALTALTSSFCQDFLNFKNRTDKNEKQKTKLRYLVHISFAVILLLVIVFFRMINDEAIINKLFTWSTYTYGPLLGLFAFGLFSKLNPKDTLVPVMCILSPVLCYFINENSVAWFSGYKFGFELIILNGLITFTGLRIVSEKR